MVKQLTVVIPTYNEADNLPKMASALFALPLPGIKLLVVDDNSPDKTGQLAEELARTTYPGRISVLHRSGKLGLGTAYVSGFQKAIQEGAEAVAQMDADFSHPPETLIEFAKALETCDAALGSRYVEGGRVDERWPLSRRFISSFGNTYAKTILRLPMCDVTGGFRAWRKETLLKMPLDRVLSNGYGFQVEMIYIAYRLGCSYKEIPIYFEDRRWGKSKMSLQIQLEAALRVWQMLFLYRDLKPNC